MCGHRLTTLARKVLFRKSIDFESGPLVLVALLLYIKLLIASTCALMSCITFSDRSDSRQAKCGPLITPEA